MTPDFFDQLEAELRAAVPRAQANAAPARVGGRRWRPRSGGLAVAISAAVTVAVVLLATGLLSHHRAAPAQPGYAGERNRPSAGPGHSATAVPTLGQLMANFAILRRPQTAQDRTWRPQCECAGTARQLSGLTRFATRVSGYRVYVDVQQQLVIGAARRTAGSDVMNVDVIGPGGSVSTASFGRNVGFTVFPLSFGGFSPHSGDTAWTSVVPDGVSAVRWRFACQNGGRPCSAPRRTFTVPVISNIATRRIPNAGICGGCASPDQVVWLGPGGQTVASFSHSTNLAAAPFVEGSRSGETLAVLHPAAIANVAFGTPTKPAMRRLTQVLGPPNDVGVRAHTCGINREAVWASPTTAEPLTVFLRAGRFVGYRYGAPTDQIALQRGPGAVLSTIRGLTLADTIGVARRLYPGALYTLASSGGRWLARGDGGVLGGAVLPIRYPLQRVTAANPVATIDAGDIGCPTLGR